MVDLAERKALRNALLLAVYDKYVRYGGGPASWLDHSEWAAGEGHDPGEAHMASQRLKGLGFVKDETGMAPMISLKPAGMAEAERLIEESEQASSSLLTSLTRADLASVEAALTEVQRFLSSGEAPDSDATRELEANLGEVTDYTKTPDPRRGIVGWMAKTLHAGVRAAVSGVAGNRADAALLALWKLGQHLLG